MSVIKWSIDSVWAGAAVIITAAGGLYTSSYHYGQVNQQVEELKARTGTVEASISKHTDQLSDIKQQNAAITQSLDDIKDSVHDIQSQVRKQSYGNHK